jgi:hypothetical protein
MLNLRKLRNLLPRIEEEETGMDTEEPPMRELPRLTTVIRSHQELVEVTKAMLTTINRLLMEQANTMEEVVTTNKAQVITMEVKTRSIRTTMDMAKVTSTIREAVAEPKSTTRRVKNNFPLNSFNLNYLCF